MRRNEESSRVVRGMKVFFFGETCHTAPLACLQTHGFANMRVWVWCMIHSEVKTKEQKCVFSWEPYYLSECDGGHQLEVYSNCE